MKPLEIKGRRLHAAEKHNTARGQQAGDHVLTSVFGQADRRSPHQLEQTCAREQVSPATESISKLRDERVGPATERVGPATEFAPQSIKLTHR